MFLKLIVVLLSSQVSSFINRSQSVVAHASPQDGSGDQYSTVTHYVDCNSIVEPITIPTTTKATSNTATVKSSHASSSIYTNNSSIATESSHSHTSCSNSTLLPTASPSQNIAMTDAPVPGENGVPACAYIVASDMGSRATCSIDYCNCGGTVAPLLFSTSGSTQIFNCDYKTQPAANSCPTLSIVTISEGILSLGNPVQTIVEGTVYVGGVCTSTVGGGETCQYSTSTSITTATATITSN